MRANIGELLVLLIGLAVAVSTIAVPVIRWFYGA